jgi:hypothetical protein
MCAHQPQERLEDDDVEACDDCVDEAFDGPTWAPCTVCQDALVNVSNGFDTCDTCLTLI